MPLPDFEDDTLSTNDQAQPRQRKIIHIDMDAFYASVEQRDNPALRAKPSRACGTTSLARI